MDSAGVRSCLQPRPVRRAADACRARGAWVCRARTTPTAPIAHLLCAVLLTCGACAVGGTGCGAPRTGASAPPAETIPIRLQLQRAKEAHRAGDHERAEALYAQAYERLAAALDSTRTPSGTLRVAPAELRQMQAVASRGLALLRWRRIEVQWQRVRMRCSEGDSLLAGARPLPVARRCERTLTELDSLQRLIAVVPDAGASAAARGGRGAFERRTRLLYDLSAARRRTEDRLLAARLEIYAALEQAVTAAEQRPPGRERRTALERVAVRCDSLLARPGRPSEYREALEALRIRARHLLGR